MRRSFRRILFWLLFCLFILTAPIAVLYSQGYRFDHERLIFIHSGAITVKSVPSNVSLYLNGKLQNASNLDIINSSMTLSGLRPGSYALKVTSDGYRDWEKSVEVHSGLSSEFWNVVLAPNSLDIKEVESSNVQRFFPSPFGKNIAYFEKMTQEIALWVTEVEQNESQRIFSQKNVVYTSDEKENLEWNSKEDMILAPVIRENQKDYLIAGLELDSAPFFLSELGKFNFLERARWSPQKKNVVYFAAREVESKPLSLYRIDLAAGKPEKILPEIVNYDLSSQSIYFLQSNNVLLKSDLEGNNTTQITSSPFSEDDLGGRSRLIAYDENRQILLSDKGDLFVHNQGETGDIIKKMGSGMRGAQFSNDGKKLLFWNNNEIFVCYLRDWEVQPYRKENQTDTIIRISSQLNNVFWYRDYEHVFFSTGNKIKLIELDPRDHRNYVELFENDLDDFPATYDSNEGIYRFVKSSNGVNKINSFEFPKKEGFFD